MTCAIAAGFIECWNDYREQKNEQKTKKHNKRFMRNYNNKFGEHIYDNDKIIKILEKMAYDETAKIKVIGACK